jgi:hypothetical protein
MPRPNPPRKRPRRRPDSVERSARAEVSLAKQTAQVKEKNGAPDARSKPNGKAQANAKSRPTGKGAPPSRLRRIDEPFVPWAKRSYAILVLVLAAAELAVGSLAYFTLPQPLPAFGLYVLGVSYNPLVPVAAALVAAPVAKLITRESRSLRFMESVMAGIMQYFVWLALFVALTYVIGGFQSSSSPSNGSPSSTSTPLPTSQASPAATTAASPSASASSSTATTSSTIATPSAVIGLLVIDLLSFVATFYLYPPLYRLMRRRPPPRGPPSKRTKPQDAKQQPAEPKAQSPKSSIDRMDGASARDPQAKDPTP